jgi:hypothetical protein
VSSLLHMVTSGAVGDFIAILQRDLIHSCRPSCSLLAAYNGAPKYLGGGRLHNCGNLVRSRKSRGN